MNSLSFWEGDTGSVVRYARGTMVFGNDPMTGELGKKPWWVISNVGESYWIVDSEGNNRTALQAEITLFPIVY